MATRRTSKKGGVALALVSLCGSLFACGGAPPRSLAKGRDIPTATGVPEIRALRDLGALGALPAQGAISVEGGDGRFDPGEWILIEGSQLGRLPTVKLGDRPVEVLARTAGGGVVGIVPQGLAAGTHTLQVVNRHGVAEKAIQVSRKLAALSKNALQLFRVVAPGQAEAWATVPFANGRSLSFSSDGRALYLLGAKGTLAVVGHLAKEGPEMLGSIAIPKGFDRGLEVHPSLPKALVYGPRGLVLIDTRSSNAPSKVWENAVAGLTQVVMDARGALFYGITEDNRLVAGSMKDGELLSNEMRLAPAEYGSFLRELRLSPQRNEVWILAGHGGVSQVGEHPVELIRAPLVSVDAAGKPETTVVRGPSYVRGWAVSRQPPVQAATAVRSTARLATMVLIGSVSAGAVGRMWSLQLDGQTQQFNAEGDPIGPVVLDPKAQWGYAAVASKVGMAILSFQLLGTSQSRLEVEGSETVDLAIAH